MSNLLNISEQEWADAIKFFSQKEHEGIVKFGKKDQTPNQNEQKCKHSFIKIGDEIYALANGEYLGKGAFGKVKVAQNRKGENLAVKIEGETQAEDPKVLSKLIEMGFIKGRVIRNFEEYKLLKTKAPYYTKQKTYTVTELLEGTDLDKIYIPIESLDPSDPNKRTTTTIQDILVAIKCTQAVIEHHRQGIIHGDIKPGNFLDKIDGNIVAIRLIDYGLSQLLTPGEKFVMGIPAGSPLYMAPEIFEGNINQPAIYSVDSDTFALGMMFKEDLFLPERIYEFMIGTDPQDRPLLTEVVDSLIGELERQVDLDIEAKKVIEAIFDEAIERIKVSTAIDVDLKNKLYKEIIDIKQSNKPYKDRKMDLAFLLFDNMNSSVPESSSYTELNEILDALSLIPKAKETSFNKVMEVINNHDSVNKSTMSVDNYTSFAEIVSDIVLDVNEILNRFDLPYYDRELALLETLKKLEQENKGNQKVQLMLKDCYLTLQQSINAESESKKTHTLAFQEKIIKESEAAKATNKTEFVEKMFEYINSKLGQIDPLEYEHIYNEIKPFVAELNRIHLVKRVDEWDKKQQIITALSQFNPTNNTLLKIKNDFQFLLTKNFTYRVHSAFESRFGKIADASTKGKVEDFLILLEIIPDNLDEETKKMYIMRKLEQASENDVLFKAIVDEILDEINHPELGKDSTVDKPVPPKYEPEIQDLLGDILVDDTSSQMSVKNQIAEDPDEIDQLLAELRGKETDKQGLDAGEPDPLQLMLQDLLKGTAAGDSEQPTMPDEEVLAPQERASVKKSAIDDVIGALSSLAQNNLIIPLIDEVNILKAQPYYLKHPKDMLLRVFNGTVIADQQLAENINIILKDWDVQVKFVPDIEFELKVEKYSTVSNEFFDKLQSRILSAPYQDKKMKRVRDDLIGVLREYQHKFNTKGHVVKNTFITDLLKICKQDERVDKLVRDICDDFEFVLELEPEPVEETQKQDISKRAEDSKSREAFAIEHENNLAKIDATIQQLNVFSHHKSIQNLIDTILTLKRQPYYHKNPHSLFNHAVEGIHLDDSNVRSEVNSILKDWGVQIAEPKKIRPLAHTSLKVGIVELLPDELASVKSYVDKYENDLRDQPEHAFDDFMAIIRIYAQHEKVNHDDIVVKNQFNDALNDLMNQVANKKGLYPLVVKDPKDALNKIVYDFSENIALGSIMQSVASDLSISLSDISDQKRRQVGRLAPQELILDASSEELEKIQAKLNEKQKHKEEREKQAEIDKIPPPWMKIKDKVIQEVLSKKNIAVISDYPELDENSLATEIDLIKQRYIHLNSPADKLHVDQLIRKTESSFYNTHKEILKAYFSLKEQEVTELVTENNLLKPIAENANHYKDESQARIKHNKIQIVQNNQKLRAQSEKLKQVKTSGKSLSISKTKQDAHSVPPPPPPPPLPPSSLSLGHKPVSKNVKADKSSPLLIAVNQETLDQQIGKLKAGGMPPESAPRPDDELRSMIQASRLNLGKKEKIHTKANESTHSKYKTELDALRNQIKHKEIEYQREQANLEQTYHILLTFHQNNDSVPQLLGKGKHLLNKQQQVIQEQDRRAQIFEQAIELQGKTNEERQSERNEVHLLQAKLNEIKLQEQKLAIDLQHKINFALQPLNLLEITKPHIVDRGIPMSMPESIITPVPVTIHKVEATDSRANQELASKVPPAPPPPSPALQQAKIHRIKQKSGKDPSQVPQINMGAVLDEIHKKYKDKSLASETVAEPQPLSLKQEGVSEKQRENQSNISDLIRKKKDEFKFNDEDLQLLHVWHETEQKMGDDIAQLDNIESVDIDKLHNEHLQAVQKHQTHVNALKQNIERAKIEQEIEIKSLEATLEKAMKQRHKDLQALKGVALGLNMILDVPKERLTAEYLATSKSAKFKPKDWLKTQSKMAGRKLFGKEKKREKQIQAIAEIFADLNDQLKFPSTDVRSMKEKAIIAYQALCAIQREIENEKNVHESNLDKLCQEKKEKLLIILEELNKFEPVEIQQKQDTLPQERILYYLKGDPTDPFKDKPFLDRFRTLFAEYKALYQNAVNNNALSIDILEGSDLIRKENTINRELEHLMSYARRMGGDPVGKESRRILSEISNEMDTFKNMSAQRQQAYRQAHPNIKISHEKLNMKFPLNVSQMKKKVQSKVDHFQSEMSQVRDKYLAAHFVNTVPESELLTQLSATMIAYANHKHGSAHALFGESIASVRKANKSKYTRSSLADNEDVQVGDFIAQAYPYPPVEGNRDQLVIDTVKSFSTKIENKNSDISRMIDIISLVSNLRSFVDRIHKSQNEYDKDPESQDIALDNFWAQFSPQADLLINYLNQSEDPHLKSMSTRIQQIKTSLYESMPKEFQEKHQFSSALKADQRRRL